MAVNKILCLSIVLIGFYCVKAVSLADVHYFEEITNRIKLTDLGMCKETYKSSGVEGPVASKYLVDSATQVIFESGVMGGWNDILRIVVSKRNSGSTKNIYCYDSAGVLRSIGFKKGISVGMTEKEIVKRVGKPKAAINTKQKLNENDAETINGLSVYGERDVVYIYSVSIEKVIQEDKKKEFRCESGTYLENYSYRIEFLKGKAVRVIYNDVMTDLDCTKKIINSSNMVPQKTCDSTNSQ